MTQLFSGITGVSSGAVDIVSPLVPGETAHPPQAGRLAVSGDPPYVNVDGGWSLLYFWQTQHSVGSNSVATTLQDYGTGNRNLPDNVVSLKDHSMSWKESSRAQKIYEQPDLFSSYEVKVMETEDLATRSKPVNYVYWPRLGLEK
jgi:hypothetical protein